MEEIDALYPQEKAMELLGITSPTYYKWLGQRRIARVKVRIDRDGFSIVRWGVPESEIIRIKALMKQGWVRGKAKMPKKTKKG